MPSQAALLRQVTNLARLKRKILKRFQLLPGRVPSRQLRCPSFRNHRQNHDKGLVRKAASSSLKNIGRDLDQRKFGAERFRRHAVKRYSGHLGAARPSWPPAQLAPL